MANTSRFPQNPQDTGSEMKHKAQDIGQQAKDTASHLGQQAKDTASNLGQKARDVASTAQDRADDALSSVGERISSLAGTLREKAPNEGYLGSAAGAIADRLESGGQYLQEHGLSDMAGDVSNVIRRNPIPSVLVGLGVGFLLGMTLRR